MHSIQSRNYMVDMMSAVPAKNWQSVGLTLLYPSSCK